MLSGYSVDVPQAALRIEWMKIGELARRTGTSCDLLRAWERRYGLLRPRRTAGGHRLYSTLDEQRVRLMLRQLAAGRRAAQAAELTAAVRLGVVPGDAASVDPAEADDAVLALARAVEGFDETAGQRVIERLLASHAPIAVVRDVVVPAAQALDPEHGDAALDVARARFARAFLGSRLGALARGWDRGPGPRALLACPAGEHRGWPAAALGIALHHCGWRIVSLGLDVPLPAIAATADRVRPDLVVLAATAPARFAPAAALRRLARTWPCVLAGPGASGPLAARCGARYVGSEPIAAALELQRPAP